MEHTYKQDDFGILYDLWWYKQIFVNAYDVIISLIGTLKYLF